MISSPASRARIISSIVSLFLVVTLALSAPSTFAAWPPDNPIPRVETVMHTAPIWRLSIDAKERFLVTASKDKTARVWDLTGGEFKLLKILRVPLGKHPHEGQIFSVAISPDGEKVAVAGYTGKYVAVGKPGNFYIHIFNRASGQLEHTISGLPRDISQLTFSRDGRYLAASLMGNFGLRVYRSSDWKKIYEDKDYGEKNDCFWVEFGPENLLITTTWEDQRKGAEKGGLRLYKPAGKSFERLGKPKKIKEGKMPIAARFSPDGSLLAVGFKDSPPKVMVFEVKSLLNNETIKPLYQADTKDLRGKDHLARVAWSRDGDLLYAGGRFSEKGIHPVLCWTEKGQGSVTRLPASLNSVMDIWPLQDGRVVFGAADPAFGVLDSKGSRHPNIPDIPDFHNKQNQFRLSDDGSLVEFAFAMQEFDLTQKTYQARLNIKTRQFTLDPPADPEGQELRPPDSGGFRLDSKGRPRYRNRALDIGDEEILHCLTRIPGGRGIILGTNWHLLFYNENGKRRGRPIELPSSAYVVNVSRDGKTVVAALGDGTLRWYSTKNRKEILAFFPHRDGRWVMWSLEGFFTCSTDGGKLLGYHLNKGLKKTPQFVSSGQLFDQFYRRDLVAWRLEKIPKNKIQAALPNGSAQKVLKQEPPPTVKIVSKKKLDEQTYRYVVQITDQGGGIGRFVYRFNGVKQEPTIDRVEDVDIPGRRSFLVTGTPGETQDISFSSYNYRNIAESEPVTDKIKVPGKRETLPSLYILSIGVGDYHGQYKELPCAVPDAENLVKTLNTRWQGVFRSPPHCKVLPNDEANLDNIEKELRKFKKKMKKTDVFILFLAGHGSLRDKRYHFILSNTDPAMPKSLSQEKLNELLTLVPAWQSLVIIDTCHAGAFATVKDRDDSEDTAFVRLIEDNGRPTLASCSEQLVAKDGVFTSCLIQGLKGEADKRINGGDGNKRIAFIELYTYLRVAVPEKAKSISTYKQKPMARFRDQEELVIAAALQDVSLAK